MTRPFCARWTPMSYSVVLMVACLPFSQYPIVHHMKNSVVLSAWSFQSLIRHHSTPNTFNIGSNFLKETNDYLYWSFFPVLTPCSSFCNVIRKKRHKCFVIVVNIEISMDVIASFLFSISVSDSGSTFFHFLLFFSSTRLVTSSHLSLWSRFTLFRCPLIEQFDFENN